MASNAKALSFLSGDLSLSGSEVSINVAGSVQSDSITGSTITMKNTGSTIVASDGTTSVLSESSGTVTIDADVSTIGSATISGGSITGTEIDLKSSGTTIFASDGTTAVLSESGGTVTLTADEANVGSNALVVDASGNVGIGTSSPSQLLSVAGNAMLQANQGFLYLSDLGTGNAGIYIRGTGTTNELRFHSTGKFNWEVAGVQKMSIDSSGNIGAPSGTNIYNASDQRLKQNITDLSGCLQKVLLMRGVSFNWINDFCDSEADKTLYGLIAQELQIIDSNLVDSFSDNTITAGNATVENPLRVNEKFIIPMLVESIKEQQAIIESQQSQIDALTARIAALETT